MMRVAIFPILFFVVFFSIFGLVIGMIIWSIVKGVKHNQYNNSQPVSTVGAKVVTKRTDTWGDNSTTYYYVTFEMDMGERIEMKMQGAEYGMLVEGDQGNLTHQGDRYIEFKRYR